VGSAKCCPYLGPFCTTICTLISPIGTAISAETATASAVYSNARTRCRRRQTWAQVSVVAFSQVGHGLLHECSSRTPQRSGHDRSADGPCRGRVQGVAKAAQGQVITGRCDDPREEGDVMRRRYVALVVLVAAVCEPGYRGPEAADHEPPRTSALLVTTTTSNPATKVTG